MLYKVVPSSTPRANEAPSHAELASCNEEPVALKPKERLAYLDHVKYACMIAIFYMHSMSEPFAYCHDSSFWNAPPPKWLYRIQIMHAEFGLPMFALCSGAVSKPDMSVDRVITYTRQLVVPVILMYYWYQFVFFMPEGKPFPTLKTQSINLVGAHNNFLWYLKALFVWRIALMPGGMLPDVLLVAVALAARCWMCTMPIGPEGPGFIGQTFLLFPFYILGYVIFAKRRLLEPFARFIAEKQALRIVSFILYVLLWLDAIFVGGYDRMLTQMMSYMRYGKQAHIIIDLVRIPISLAFGFVATAWLPQGELPIVSEAGKQTLYCYMFNTTAVMCSYNFWRFLSRPAGPIWSTWVVLQPLVVLAFSSAPLRFVVWPFASPGWALRDPRQLSLETATEEKWVKQVGVPGWLGITVLVHVIFIGGTLYWGSPRHCAVD